MINVLCYNGTTYPEPLINYSILLGKYCIYKFQVIGSKPNIYLFKGWIDFLIQVENHIALEKHDNKWRTFNIQGLERWQIYIILSFCISC